MAEYSIDNTFAINANANAIIYWPQQAELFDKNEPFLITGAGSNLLFVDSCFNGQVIMSGNQTFKVSETDSHYIVELGAGLNWHETVQRLLDLGIYGLENLALIPGTVGASPVQNIGAYGVELSDFCYQVEVIDLLATNDGQSSTNQVQSFKLSHTECQFGYRDSIFKHQYKQQYLIHQVTLKLTKNWQAKLNYAPLNQLLAPQSINTEITAQQVFDTVCQVRQQKLPDPKITPNAGSFFKNPIVDKNLALKLKQIDVNLPLYPTSNDQQVKVAAGYLIDQAGLKGFSLGAAGVHSKQALVLVNTCQATGQQIAELADYIRQKVFAKYQIWLEPEVRFISAQGEVNAIDFLNQCNTSATLEKEE